MDVPLQPESQPVLDSIYQLFRDYFDRAEKKRRWSIRDDIPWEQCNRSLNPAISDVVETFCAVELFLPDYLSKLIPQVRCNRGRAWMLANWGYEECKHSMVLEDWLLRARMRSDEQMTDMHNDVFDHEWNLPYGSSLGMLCYTMFQELATQLHYANLRNIVRREGGCPALEKTLLLVAIDEAAHADFFRRLVGLYLEHDRAATLEQIRSVANSFQMPSVDLLSESSRRAAQVREFEIFNESIYISQVVEPVLRKLNVSRKELRRRAPRERVVPLAGANMKP